MSLAALPLNPAESTLSNIENRVTTELRSQPVFAYLQLARPANLVTAAADILAGYAVAGLPSLRKLLLLCAASVCLYAGGVVLNDVFDADLDSVERPERPIPSGRVERRPASQMGFGLLLAGIALGFAVSLWSGGLAVSVAALAVLYDSWGKRQEWIGPMNMAACRAANLLLGISAGIPALATRWFLCLIPFAYIAAVTSLSKGEVHGATRARNLIPLAIVSGVIAALLLLGLTPGFVCWSAVPFIVVLAWRVLPPFARAWQHPSSKTIRIAVLAGVLSLISLDSAIAAGYASILYGIFVLSLSLIAGGIARLFAVT